MTLSTIANVERGRGTWFPLLHELGRHRILVIGYLIVMAAWLLTVGRSGFGVTPEVFHEILGEGGQTAVDENSSRLVRIVILAAYLLLQGVFLWGGGRIRLRRRPTRFRNIALSLFVFAALMSLLSYGLVLCFYEMIHRLEGSWLMGDDSRLVLVELVVGGWVLWMVVGWIAVRGMSHHGALSRLTTTLLAGSWVEFVVSLPVELVTRPRTEECPCASGSWLALLICVPVLLWAIGPAVFLLYLWERRVSERDPRHAVAVLLAKSRSRGGRRRLR